MTMIPFGSLRFPLRFVKMTSQSASELLKSHYAVLAEALEATTDARLLGLDMPLCK